MVNTGKQVALGLYWVYIEGIVGNTQINGAIIQQNYVSVVERIRRAAGRAGRDPSDIRLVVVTKTQPVDVIQAVIEAGAIDLGENYVEEAIPKIQALAGNPKIRWHMIGHIQSRKAQEVCQYFQYAHSVDSVKLAERLSRFAHSQIKPLLVWMEYNVGGEESKSGWDITHRENWGNLVPELEKIFSLPDLEFLGVMCVPPYSLDPEASRAYYQLLKDFQSYVRSQLHLNGFTGMSMGMSNDFEVAIEEGSTCVRIGQAILGPRSR